MEGKMNQISASLGGVLADAPVAMKYNGRFVVWQKGEPFPPEEFHATERAAEAQAARIARETPSARPIVIQFRNKLWLKGAPRIPAKQSGRSYIRPLLYLFGLVTTVTLAMIALSNVAMWIRSVAAHMVSP